MSGEKQMATRKLIKQDLAENKQGLINRPCPKCELMVAGLNEDRVAIYRCPRCGEEFAYSVEESSIPESDADEKPP